MRYLSAPFHSRDDTVGYPLLPGIRPTLNRTRFVLFWSFRWCITAWYDNEMTRSSSDRTLLDNACSRFLLSHNNVRHEISFAVHRCHSANSRVSWDAFFRGASLRKDIMPATRPRELQFQFGLVDLVARDILTQARRAENGVRRAAVLGSYELLNCFVTVRRDSNEPRCRCRCCCCNPGGGVSRDRFRTSRLDLASR